MAKKKNTTKKRYPNLLFRIALCVALFHFSSTCLHLFVEYRSNHKEEIKLQQEIERLQIDIDSTKHLLENTSEQELIEKAARERFDYAYPNEIIYVDAS